MIMREGIVDLGKLGVLVWEDLHAGQHGVGQMALLINVKMGKKKKFKFIFVV